MASCEGCGAPLTRSTQKKFCSLGCASAKGFRSYKPRVCPQCLEPFKPTHGNQRFCSRSCSHVTRSCATCGEGFSARRTESQQFCSVKCASKGTALRGPANPHYNGGLYLDKRDGRAIIVCRDGSEMRYSRAVMEVQIGRPLLQDEHVHHKNGDKTDDRPENLQIVTPEEHIALHQEELHAWRKAAA